MRRQLAAALLVAACSGSSEEAAKPLELSLSIRVTPGTEMYRCQLFQPVSEETFVVATSHSYTAGSHHMLLLRTDLTEIPENLAGVRDCYEEGGGLMSHIRGVIHGGQQPTGEVTFPDGVGLAIEPGEVLMLQAHYLNASTEPLDADVHVTLRTAPASSVRERAGMFFFYNPFIYVGAAASARATMSCRVRQPVTLLTATSHMHARGTGYAAYLDTGGVHAEAPFFTTTSWDHPSGWQGPLAIAADSVVRFECAYTNPENRVFLQGQSAATNEMCMFIGVYYPALDRTDELCAGGPFSFGAGTASCSQTLSCIRTCPPGTAPTPGQLLESGRPDVDECWQRCFASACPTAWTPFYAQVSCIQSKCAAACATPGSSACTTCVAGNCLGEYLACNSATCP